MIRLLVASALLALMASPPRPASGQAPTVRVTAGYEWAPVTVPAVPTRTPAETPGLSPRPGSDHDAARAARVAPDRATLRGKVTVLGTALPGRLSGYATWYRTAGLVAAAGPALRRSLGKGWRGDRVVVTSGDRTVVVTLSDFCACGPRHGVPTLLDLSDGAYRRLAPLSTGVIRVRVLTSIPLPATDR